MRTPSIARRIPRNADRTVSGIDRVTTAGAFHILNVVVSVLFLALLVAGVSGCSTATAGSPVVAASTGDAGTAVATSTVVVTTTEVESADRPTTTTVVTVHGDGMATTTADPVTVTVTEPAPEGSDGSGGGDATAREGFHDVGNGMWFDWADASAFDCPSGATACWGVQVWNAAGCPDGVQFRLDVYKADTDDRVTTLSWKTNTPLPAGEAGLYVPNTSAALDVDTEAELIEAGCA